MIFMSSFQLKLIDFTFLLLKDIFPLELFYKNKRSKHTKKSLKPAALSSNMLMG